MSNHVPVQQCLKHERSDTSTILLPGEIAGVATTLLYAVPEAELELSVGSSVQVAYFLLDGAGVLHNSEQQWALAKHDLFVPMPDTKASFIASKASVILSIQMNITHEEFLQLKKGNYPLIRRYKECEQYRDYFKSAKTVSRTIVHPFTLPRFAMGSVQTSGPDRIEPHAHAMLDQLFFSFPENNCKLLVDGESVPFLGSCLLHVPLGSNHGIDAFEGDIVHYLWIDFFENAEDMQYLVDIHKPVA